HRGENVRAGGRDANLSGGKNPHARRVLGLHALPFRAGDVVEVIVLAREDKMPQAQAFPLQGKVLKYDNPTEPVAQDDWDVLRWFCWIRISGCGGWTTANSLQ